MANFDVSPFSIYNINTKVKDGGIIPLSLAGLPITFYFENGGLKQIVNTNEQGESIFIGPPGKFNIYGIKAAESPEGGMTTVDLTMDTDTGGAPSILLSKNSP